MASLPHNLQRRAFAIGGAPYRAWDGAGAPWLIDGKPGAWRALPRDTAAPSIFAPTLDRLGAKLTAITPQETEH